MARPRDPDLDVRIIETYRLLAEREGAANVTITAVADESGVSRPAIYRRWPSAAALRFEAQTNSSVRAGFPDLGSFRADLVHATGILVDTMRAGDRSVSAEMLGQMIADEDFAREVWTGRWEPDRRAVMPIWERAVRRGEVSAEADGESLVDDLVAACLFRVQLLHRDVGPAEVEALVDRLIAGVGTA